MSIGHTLCQQSNNCVSVSEHNIKEGDLCWDLDLSFMVASLPVGTRHLLERQGGIATNPHVVFSTGDDARSLQDTSVVWCI